MIIPEKLLAECHTFGIAAYPEESCGFIVGIIEQQESMDLVIPMNNIMNQLHADDPETYPRTARDGYVIDPREHMMLERKLKKEGKKIKVIFHSHPDVGAYFSEKDKEDALWNGKARYPGITFLVCATNQGIAEDAILADFNEEKCEFDITHIDKLQPSKESFQVGGKHGITGILPNLEYIHQWKNGERELEHGYFRFVPPPQIKQLQNLIYDYYGIRHALAFCTGKSALLELLNYLKESFAKFNLFLGVEDQELIQDALALEISCHNFSFSNLPEPETLSGKQGDVILISNNNATEFINGNQNWFKNLKRQKVPVIVFAAMPAHFDLWPIGITYWVSNFTNQPDNDDSEHINGGVIFGNADRQMAELAELRKRRGPVLSSRDASVFCEQFKKENTKSPLLSQNLKIIISEKKVVADQELKKKLCNLEMADDCLLFPTGMAAIMALITVLRNKNTAKTKVIVIGLLYSETYALLMDSGRYTEWDAEFLDTDEIARLPELLTEDIAFIITETITNPLGAVPDLKRIGKIANQHQIPFVVDNTLASPLNCQPLTFGADFVIQSTTKYLSGCNQHGGGAVFVNNTENAALLCDFQKRWELYSSGLENKILADCLVDFEDRMEKFNSNGNKIAIFLEQHPMVERVYHASLKSHPSYEVAKKILTGIGGVVSFTLINKSETSLKELYDGEFNSILKAPTLGSNKTLICPYALLTHYHDSEEDMKEINLPRHLIRISAGSEEDISIVIKDLNKGLHRVSR